MHPTRRRRTAALLQRLKTDSQLRLITLLGLTTAFMLSLFAIFRASRGEWAAALTDAAIVVVLCGPVAWALRTGSTRGPGLVLCVTNSIACAVAAWVIGPTASQWLYLVLMTNFFITTPLPALASNLLLTVTVLLMPHLFGPGFQTAAVAVTAALVTMFAYLFAVRVRDDQKQLETMASLDALTGVPNRRMMEREMTSAVERRRERGDSYGLIILDLDLFKEVNDTFGHAAGDAAIADLAAILKFEMRSGDSIFRFGGEEFVAVVAVKTAEELQAIAERMRMAVRNGLRGPAGRITVSLGAAMLGSEDRWQEWFSLADEALYRAKKNGRDNVVVSALQP